MKRFYHLTTMPHNIIECNTILSCLVICCSILYSISCNAQTRQRHFESVCGKEKNIIIWNEKTENNIIFLTTSQNSEVHHYRLSPLCTTLSKRNRRSSTPKPCEYIIFDPAFSHTNVPSGK